MAVITIKSNDDTREFQVSPAGTSNDAVGIGRSADNQLQISSSTVSNQHARIVYEGEEIVIYDLNSATGTFVNKQPISRHILNLDDSIVIGNRELVYTGLKTEAPDTSPSQISENPKSTELSKQDADDLTDEVGDSNLSADRKVDGPEQLDETIDIVEPWAHLEAQDDTEVSDDFRDIDTPEPLFDSIIDSTTSKEQPTTDGGSIQQNNQTELGSTAADIVNPMENVADTPDDSIDESLDKTGSHRAELTADMRVKNAHKQANATPIEKLKREKLKREKPKIKRESPGREGPLNPQQKIDPAESSASVHRASRGKSNQSTPRQKNADLDIRESAGQKTSQIEPPWRRHKPIKLDFELPDPDSQTESKTKNDPAQDHDTVFVSTSPDLFRSTGKKSVESAEQQSTKRRKPRPQTTLEIVSPVVAKDAEAVTEPKRGKTSGPVEPQAPKDSHLLIQAGPNVGNRVALKQDRTILGINNRRCVAVTRGKDTFLASSLDSDITVSINSVPLNTKPLALKDGDSLEFFDVRLRFVA